MQKITLLTLLIFLLNAEMNAQTKVWSSFVDSVVTLSSPRSCDLNQDGVKDILIGGGRDGLFSVSGIMAYDGVDGSLLWEQSCRDEVFGSAIFQDVTGDGIQDVFIVGREAQLLCLDAVDGSIIWDFFPYGTNPKDSGWYNFYNPQFIHDVNNDGFPDILVSNGGDHAAPSWDSNRPIGRIMIISALDGEILANAQVLDGAETYCSPIIADIQNNGQQWILYGTGGEYFGGSFWACPLQDLILTNSLASSLQLLEDPLKGFVAPPSIHRTPLGHFDIVVQSFGGKISKINGANFSVIWDYYQPNTQSSAALVLGSFTGDFTPDVFAVLYKGQVPSFTDYYQLMLDGATGEPVFFDSLGALHYASANAVDLNNDGRDEVIVTVTHHINGYFEHQLHSIDFLNGTITDLTPLEAGVNIASTPLIVDADNNGSLELFYVVKYDSINPMGWKGFYINRLDLAVDMPNSGIAWGSYMGTGANGQYNFELSNCGANSIIASAAIVQPSCNGFEDGSIQLQVHQPMQEHTFVWEHNAVGAQLTALNAGTYQVLVTNDAGCYEVRQFILNNPYVLSFGGIVSPTCPNGENGQVVVSSTGCPCMFNTCQFLWDNEISVTSNNTAHEGYNRVTILHPDGCSVTDSVFVPLAEPVQINSTVIDVVCEGGITGEILVSDGNQYPLTAVIWGNGATTFEITDLNEGIYAAEISDSRGCVDSVFIEVINDNTGFVEYGSSIVNVSCNGLADGSIELFETGVYVFTEIVWWDESTQYVNENLLEGSYWARIVDERGCRDTVYATVVQPEPIVLDLFATGAYGASTLDGTATVSVSGGVSPYSYDWSDPNNQDNDLAVYLNPGWYTVEVTDANGCTASDNVFVVNLTTQELNGEVINVFPNPFNEKIWVSSNCLKKEYTLYDVQGRIVDRSILNSLVIETQQLVIGVYVLEINFDDTILLFKVIKE
jgi:hypothetical protein